MLENLFKLKEKGTTPRTEVISGVTTFMTMAYIIFVQPVFMSAAGMDFGAVMVATCISSAIATLLMGFLANYPIALAPAMGHNAFFTYVVCIGMGVPWQTALGAVFISGMLFIILSFFGFREKIINAIPRSLKNAIAVGIGLFIAFIGFQHAGLVKSDPNTFVTLGNLGSAPVLLAIFGIFLIAVLMALKIKGALLIGIIVTALIGIPLGIVKYYGIISTPPSLAPTFFKLDVIGAFNMGLLSVIFIFFFLDLFDTIGTLIGISEQAGFIVDGKLPRARQALFSDAVGTVTGSLLGTSTVTSYIESSAGVASGGRTGLSNLVTAGLFILSIAFYPLAKMIGGGYNGLYPVTAPALIIVGSMMLPNVTKIKWEDITESIPAFLTLIIMPFTYSITDGIAIGFISYVILKLVTRKGKEVHPLLYIFSCLFILRYVVMFLPN